MPRTKQGAKVTDLQALQTLVVKALSKEIKDGMTAGELNQAAVRNALQLFRDNDIVAVDDTINEVARLESLLPRISLEDVQRTQMKYS